MLLCNGSEKCFWVGTRRSVCVFLLAVVGCCKVRCGPRGSGLVTAEGRGFQ